jgi:hypothetical protein
MVDGVLQPMRRRPPALLLTGGYRVRAADATLASLAFDAGFRPMVVPWFRVSVTPTGTYVAHGYEDLGGGARRTIDGWERVAPGLVLHRMTMTGASERLLARLAAANPEALLSHHPCYRELETAQGTATCLRAGGAGHWLASPKDESAAATVRRYALVLFPLLTVVLQTVSDPAGAAEGFAERAHELVEEVVACLAAWPPLAAAPEFARLVAFAAFDLVPVHGVGGMEPRLASWTLSPTLARLGSGGAEDPAADVYGWLELLAGRVTAEATMELPYPDPASHPPRAVLSESARRPPVLVNAVALLNDLEGRSAVSSLLGGSASQRGPLDFRADDDRLKGCTFRLQVHAGRPVLDLVVDEAADLDPLVHPLASVLPCLHGETGLVQTKPWPGATFRYLDPALVGPAHHGREDRAAALLAYLGRVTTTDPPPDGLGRRFVEPGVGRACLVDFVRLDDRPELADFSATGVGLTPYSAGGYVEIGRAIDGRVALKRAVHRKRCSERLEDAGGRAGRVAAIVDLPGDHIMMPDRTVSPAVLIVRGFRCVLRVKQLDPIACFYHSIQHAPQIIDALLDPVWDAPGTPPDGTLALLPFALDRYGPAADDLRRVLDVTRPPWAWTPADDAARMRRLRVIDAYAPLLLDVAKGRLAVELGRDPMEEPLSDGEYVTWFAATLGRQLGIMHRLRFLHDYHHPGISRYTPSWQYTLTENNVTLLAEFPDLDTGIFVDRFDAAIADELQLSRADIDVLRAGYEAFHLDDVHAARSVTASLALIALHGDRDEEAQAGLRFQQAYETEVAG